MYISKVVLKIILALKHPGANVTLEGLHVTNIMYCGQVRFQVPLMCKLSAANVALKGLHVTNTMYCRQVCFQAAFLCKLPATDVTLVSGVRTFWSTAAVLRMRRVVVNADR